MDTDTTRTITQILNNGYYRKGTTLGEGGWGKVYSFAGNWNEYTLYNISGDVDLIETIHAEDDETALKAFGELYHLDQFAYEIYCRVTTYRMVASTEEVL